VDPERPDRSIVEKTAGIVVRGGVIIYPTRGLYGLGADALNPAAVKRVFDLKGRDHRKALLVLIADMQCLQQVARPPAGAALHLMRFFWPGKVTFVLPARNDLPPALTGKGLNIGVRIPGHPVAAALVKALGRPLIGTSANLSEAGGCADAKQLDPALVAGVDCVLDAGALEGGAGSSVVDLTGSVPRILRAGAVSAAQIMAAFDRYRRQHVDKTS
jgi:L-threonylcarbamoyladenylate synthase